ncbi:MAG: hypothetical protein WC788_01785 [Candidatus Paceibacterota bacterium]|jgi:hypothetical protein
MIKIDEKTDKGYFAALRELLELYKKGAKEGNYYRILPQDIVAESISLEGRETLSSEEEGLRELGKAIYYAMTGNWEYNDPSIKLDGYPPIKVFFWPVLEIMLSRGGAMPSIEMVETEIRQIEGGQNKTKDEQKKDTETLNVKETGKEQSERLICLLLQEGCTLSNVKAGEEDPHRDIRAADVIVVPPVGNKVSGQYKDAGHEILFTRPDNETYAIYPLMQHGYKISGESGNEIRLRKIEPDIETKIIEAEKDSGNSNDVTEKQVEEKKAVSLEDLLIGEGCEIEMDGDDLIVIAPNACRIAHYVGSDGRQLIALEKYGELIGEELYEPKKYGYSANGSGSSKKCYLKRIAPRDMQIGTEAGKFLDDLEIIIWTEDIKQLHWKYHPKKGLVYLDVKNINPFKEAGLVDKKSRVHVPWTELFTWSVSAFSGKKIGELREKLKGRRVESVYDGSKNGWFLRVL